MKEPDKQANRNLNMKSKSVMITTVCIPILMAAYGVGQMVAATLAPSAKNEPESAIARAPEDELLVAAAESGGGGGLVISDPTNVEDTQKKLIIKGIEPTGAGGFGGGFGGSGGVGGFGGGGWFERDRTWLGLGTEEAPEALSSQLGLDPGVGLVVTYVSTNSPAAKAGVQKNDVLVEFEGQGLSVPAQLRKLVQARKEGDKVKIVYLRGGKKHTTTATLEQTKGGGAMNWEGLDLQAPMRELQRQLQDGPFREAMRDSAREVRKSLETLKLDQGKIKDEIEKSLEEAKRAIEKAMREATNARQGLDPAHRALRELERSEVFLDKSPSVVVRSSSNQVKSVVKSDDAGTLVIVANPEPRLTAHDKEGKLVFDGPIGTQEEKDKVPRELWERLEPLLDQVQKTPEAEEK